MGCCSSTPPTTPQPRTPPKPEPVPVPPAKPTSATATDENQFEKFDAYARKAPSSLKTSVEDLVNYRTSFSKDPKTLARSFLVWISENIRYDADGFFGRAAMAPNDVLGVMKGGRGVCEGYANVMDRKIRQYFFWRSIGRYKAFSLRHTW